MDMNEYQRRSSATAIYPGRELTALAAPGLASDEGVIYNALALAGEAGEIAGKVSKALRDHNGVIHDSMRRDLLKEAGDALWHLTQLISCLGGSLEDVAEDNLAKLADRQKRGVLGGSGDSR